MALFCTILAGACTSTQPAPTTTPGSDSTARPAVPDLPGLRLPEGVRPTRYAVELDLDPARDHFAGTVTIDIELAQKTAFLWLHGTDLAVDRATVQAGDHTVAARPVEGDADMFGLALEQPVGPGQARLQIAYRGAVDSVRSRGIYRVKEPDGNWYAYTFFEPVDARRAMPCFDEPGFKVPWQLTIATTAGNVAVANTPEVSRQTMGERTKYVFADTPPMPSYLLAFVVGPFELESGGVVGQNKVPLRFVVPRGRAGELGYAKQVTPRAIELLEAYFAMPYPYKKLDVAVVPRYWGTMEHPGIVAMGQPLTLIKPEDETVLRKRHYANILIHELCHYWFGNYVTTAWWDDTWLNEALATWLDAKLTQRLEPSWRFAMQRLDRNAGAMAADSLTSAKSIRQPVATRTDITSSFDGAITYAKGAAVVHMFEQWIGADKFRQGIHDYLAGHAWGNATSQDFLAMVSRQASPKVATAMATFLDQPGIPLVSAKLICATAKTPHLVLAQERFLPTGSTGDAGQRWHIPICVRYGAGTHKSSTCALMDKPRMTMELSGIKGCPDWVLANKGGDGYYRVAYEKPLRDRLLGRGKAELSTAELLAVVQDIKALVDSGALGIVDALALAPALLSSDDRFVVEQGMGILGRIRTSELPDALQPNYQRLVDALLGARARKLGWTENKGESLDDHMLRPAIVTVVAMRGSNAGLVAEAGKLARAWLKDSTAVAPDLVDPVLRVAAYHGDRALFDELLAAARAIDDRRRRTQILGALGGFRDPALMAEALALIAGDEFDIRDIYGMLFAGLGKRETREQTYAFIKDNYDTIFSRLRDDEKSWSMAIPGLFCDAEHRQDAEAFFGPRAARIDGGPRALAKSLERIDLCIAAQKRDAADIAEFLGKY